VLGAVRGVHYRLGWDGHDERSRPEAQKVIHWAGQRIYKGERQTLVVELLSPSGSFDRHRATLYGILDSIRFAGD
jgi:hypothetical protein